MKYRIWALCIPVALFGYFIPYVHLVRHSNRMLKSGYPSPLPLLPPTLTPQKSNYSFVVRLWLYLIWNNFIFPLHMSLQGLPFPSPLPQKSQILIYGAILLKFQKRTFYMFTHNNLDYNFRNGGPFLPSPPPWPLKQSNFSFVVQFWSNLNWKFLIFSPLINKITIWKECKGRFECDNDLYSEWDNHCDSRFHVKSSPELEKFAPISKCRLFPNYGYPPPPLPPILQKWPSWHKWCAIC